MSADFHRQAAQEMKTFLDALHLEQAILWGHSDGSVIAIHMALAEPHRFPGMILEAFHLYKNKPASHEFFDTMMRQPEALGERVVSVLSAEHGEEDWEKLIRMNGIAWLRIAEQAQSPQEDLFEGRLPDLQVPSFFLHGNRDPRTEADELARVQQQLPDAMIRLIDGGGHSPHSETSTAITTNQLAQEFFDYLRSQSSIP